MTSWRQSQMSAHADAHTEGSAAAPGGLVGAFLVVAGLVAAGLVWGGCPKAGTGPDVTTATAAPSPPWWMSLKDGKIHSGLDEAPIGLYAAGTLEDGRFVPGGDIEGSGPIDAEGQRGFMDLATGRFIARGEPEPPPPYVEGAMTPSGFSPASRKVTYGQRSQKAPAAP